MASTSTLRARRSRMHKRGDHSLCRPEHCEEVRPPETASEDRETPLGVAGGALWKEMTEDGQLPPLQSRLLLEACRIADRLDRLDRQLYGGDWLTFDADNDSGQVTVVVDRVLAESRQQALAFKQIVAELRQSQTVSRPGRKPASAAQGKVKSSGGAGANISDLAAFAASRGASPAG